MAIAGKLHKYRESRFVRFCIVGFSNFVIISLTVWIMMDLLHCGYKLSNVCGYALAIASSFVWNKIWVFRSEGNSSLRREIMLYLAAFFCAYFLQFAFVYVAVEWLGLNEYLAQFIGLFVYGATNFFMNKLLTFKNPD